MIYRNTKLVGNKKTLVSQEAYKYYRERAKRRDKEKTNERKHFAKTLNNIYRKVRDQSLEFEGGVYAPSYFYIVPQPYPQKKFVKVLQKGGEYRGTLNIPTKGRVYTLLFVNLLTGKKRKLWDMSGTFFPKIREKMSNRLKEQKVRYLFSLDTLKKVR